MLPESALEFDWDPSNLDRLARYRISSSEFEQALMNQAVLADFVDESGEKRWYALGAATNLRLLFMVFTWRGERIRPITAWEPSEG